MRSALRTRLRSAQHGGGQRVALVKGHGERSEATEKLLLQDELGCDHARVFRAQPAKGELAVMLRAKCLLSKSHTVSLDYLSVMGHFKVKKTEKAVCVSSCL